MHLNKKSQRQTVIREKLHNLLSYEKCVHKTLMKLTLIEFDSVQSHECNTNLFTSGSGI